MASRRVYQIAKDLGLPYEDVLAACEQMGIHVRNHMSGVEEMQAEELVRQLEKKVRDSIVEVRIAPTVLRRKSPTVPSRERPPMVRRPAAPAEAPEPVEGAVPPPAAERPSAEPAEATAAAPSAPAPETPVAAAPPVAEPPAAAAPAAPQRIVLPIGGRAPGAPEADRPALRPLGAVGPRRLEVIRGRDIYAGRGAVRPTRSKRRKAVASKPARPAAEVSATKAAKRVVKIEGGVTLQDLARNMSVKATEVLFKLIGLGIQGVNINSGLDPDTAKLVAAEFGYEVVDKAFDEVGLLAEAAKDVTESAEDFAVRPPVVTIMGHVDHGKTSLLDHIQKTKIAQGEAGGITQHIGSYFVETPHGPVVFLDTPGHEAFTAMRARGAQVTDVVVLVVAADDGLMPQTLEAISHARAAGVPLVVAVNKIDKNGADPERVKRQLAEQDLLPEEWGGQTIVAEVSALTGQGVDNLLEMVALQAEVLDLKANPNRPARGVVIEAYLDRGRGPVANVLVKDGTLHTGDFVVAGEAFGKIRALADERGKPVKEALPSRAVEVLGLSVVPNAGDVVNVVPEAKQAQAIAEGRSAKAMRAPSGGPAGRLSLEDFLKQKMQEGGPQDLNLIIKTDVQGSSEALVGALGKLSTDVVKVNILHASPGGITESDVLLAAASRAIVIGFNVRPAGKARKMAEQEKVDIRFYNVIYDALDDVRKAMAGLLKPTIEESFLGRADVREVFNVSKVGTVAGCVVSEGKIVRSAVIRLLRDHVQIWEGKIGSLKRFKDDVREVANGYECGIHLDGYNDVKPGDAIEAFERREVAPTL
jgi:translation initiation factor IF-2